MAVAYDVVCGMKVNTETSPHAEYEDATYYFCCNGYKGAFEKAPDHHLENWAEEHPDVDPAAVTL